MTNNHETTDHHNEHQAAIHEFVNNNQEAFQKPKELLKLEVGAASGTGFDPNRLAYDGATIVTVNAPYGLDRGDTTLPNDTNANMSGYNTGHNAQLAKNLQRAIERKGETEYPYKFVAIVGDGRNMDYFEDGMFSEVMFDNVISDPSIEPKSAAQLITEALRVGDEVHLDDDITAFATTWRLDFANLEEAGIIRTTTDALDEKYGDTSREILTKAENFGDVPLVLPAETPIYYHEYEKRRQVIDAEARRQERIATFKREKAERQARRREKRSKVLSKFGLSKAIDKS